ncbi:flagellar filament capping protein FliD [Halothermothrix orenii]|uniref:Flagellar hook-associated protein 2 n=1 Tax=Halothermothrix orenii (strain H 168 / OCM 544 / DSM 9562) TaxID=373903 RepID=B8CYT6_HALOH|nr:flagellar filament capping protein FliD [Halothermothrix orenii]ACL70455.1 flagellar hook-associated 2 domain protein [Halothermothrix orenii H 168]
MSFSIGGLGTGLDTNQIIDQMMQIERRPIYLLQQQQEEIQSDLSAWGSVESKLNSFKSKVDDIESIFGKMAVTVNDTEVVDVTVDSSASLGTYNIEITQLAQSHAVASDAQDDSTSNLNLSGTFSINGTDITVNTDDSLEDIKNLINQTSDTGVTANIIDNTLVLKSNETGTTNSISISDVSDSVAQQLGLISDAAGTIKNELQTAQDAIFSLDGLSITRSSNEINDVIQGVTISLKKGGGASTQFTVNKDIGGMIEEIKALIGSYNSAAGTISSMTEKDGELQGDVTLNQIAFKLRRNLTDPFFADNSAINQLSLIGIESDRYGNISVNETELSDALENSFEDVKALFTATSSTEGYSGLQERMSNYLSSILDSNGFVDGTKEMLQEQIDDINEEIQDLEYSMTLREQKLRQDFIAMENAVASMNNQLSWLQGQFSNMSSGLSSLGI